MKPAFPPQMPAAVRGALLSLLLGAALPALADTPAERECGRLSNPFGPFEYQKVDQATRNLVEDYHFTPMVEELRKGNTGLIGTDIDYTLRVFPTHHRALLAMMRLGEKYNVLRVPGAHWSVECYFDRALRFNYKDTVVRSLYATFLFKRGLKDTAYRQLDVAAEFAGTNPFSHYNIGLLFLEFGNYPKALEQAHRAQALGFDVKELKKALQEKGQWSDTPPAPAAAAASAADAALAPGAAASATPAAAAAPAPAAASAAPAARPAPAARS